MEEKVVYGKLKGRMTEKGYTIRKLSDEAGIPLTTLSYKLNGLTEFKASEMYTLCQILDIKNVKEYFFDL